MKQFELCLDALPAFSAMDHPHPHLHGQQSPQVQLLPWHNSKGARSAPFLFCMMVGEGLSFSCVQPVYIYTFTHMHKLAECMCGHLGHHQNQHELSQCHGLPTLMPCA